MARHRFVPRRTVLLAIAVLATVSPRGTHGQDSLPDSHPSPNECFRFAFGKWSTPLDWKSAGHARTPTDPAAGSPRGDASRAGTDAMTDIVIYPAWWPVGVYLAMDATRTVGDTLFGIATAFVADGNVAAPTAPVRALRVPCMRSARVDSTPSTNLTAHSRPTAAGASGRKAPAANRHTRPGRTSAAQRPRG